MQQTALLAPLVFAACLASLPARPARADLQLTWTAAVAETARENADLHSAKASLQAAKDAETAAYSTDYPEISGSLDYSYGNNGSTSLNPTGNLATSGWGASLNGSESVFSGFRDQGHILLAKAATAQSQANLELLQAKVSDELTAAYAGLIYAQRAVDLQKEILERRTGNLNVVTLRFESGGENKGSVLLSKAYLAQANYDALLARDNIEVARAALSRAMGRDEPAEFKITDTVPEQNPPPAPDFRGLATDTPTHRRVVAQAISTEAGVTVARAGFFPTLNVSAVYGWQGPSFFPQHDRWSVGASLTLPIFSGGRDYYGTKGALESFKAAIFNLNSTDRELLTQLRQTYHAFAEAIVKLAVDQSFVDASSVREEIARNQYNNGLISFNDWDIIESDMINRQKSRLDSERNRITTQSSWQQTQGKGVIQ